MGRRRREVLPYAVRAQLFAAWIETHLPAVQARVQTRGGGLSSKGTASQPEEITQNGPDAVSARQGPRR